MDPAACNDRDKRSLSDIKIIINNVRHTGCGDHYRNMHLLSPGFPADVHVNSGLILFPLDLDMLCTSMAQRIPIVS